MLLADFAVCSDPGGLKLCESCKRNIGNHDERTREIVAARLYQANIAPDSRPGSCRHHVFISTDWYEEYP